MSQSVYLNLYGTAYKTARVRDEVRQRFKKNLFHATKLSQFINFEKIELNKNQLRYREADLKHRTNRQYTFHLRMRKFFAFGCRLGGAGTSGTEEGVRKLVIPFGGLRSQSQTA